MLRNDDYYEYDPEKNEQAMKGDSMEIDIVLLILEKPLYYVLGKVESIPIPSPGSKFPKNPNNCYVSGWGRTKTAEK